MEPNDKILQVFQASNGYIEHIDQLLTYMYEKGIDHDTINVVLKEAFFQNDRIYQAQQKELNQRNITKQPSLEISSHQISLKEKQKNRIEPLMKPNLSHYLELLKECSDLASLKELMSLCSHEDELPIIDFMILELQKEKTEIQMLINEELDHVTSETLTEFKDEILIIQEKIGLLLTYKANIKNPIQVSDVTKNSIVFLKTNAGKACLMSDLDVDDHYFPSFYELISSIQNRTFKNFKRLISNLKFQGLLEVRGYQTRVVFQQLESSVYILISAFVKKSQVDLGTYTTLEDRIASLYTTQQQDALKCLQSDQRNQFLEEHQVIEKKIMKHLKVEKQR